VNLSIDWFTALFFLLSLKRGWLFQRMEVDVLSRCYRLCFFLNSSE
jgi:hypothetical protein